MTLYYSMVFIILMTEMVVFVGLIIPLPFKIKRKLFTFISESPIVAKIQYGMKITFIFILILFIDSVNRVYRVQVELAASAREGGAGGAASLGSERMEVQARKFYSQRNMYLCGFTLFLSLILNQTYVMILNVLRLEEKVKMYEGDDNTGGKNAKKLDQAGSPGEIGTLKSDLHHKDKELQKLKSQAQDLQQNYDELSVKYNKIANQDHTPKKDR